MDGLIEAYLKSEDAPAAVHEFEVRASDPLPHAAYLDAMRCFVALGFEIKRDQKMLRINTGTTRVEVNGLMNINKYCQTELLETAVFRRKTKLRSDTNPYHMKGSLATEHPLTEDEIAQVRGAWPHQDKVFRLMHRLTLAHADYPCFEVDCTTVKMSRPTKLAFRALQLDKYATDYEVEIEAVKRAPFDVFKRQLNKCCTALLSGVQGTAFPVAHAEIQQVLAGYAELVKPDKKLPLTRWFVGPQSVALQPHNLNSKSLKQTLAFSGEDEELPDVLNSYDVRKNYTVTDKADGLRKLLYIYKERAYFVNSRMRVEFCGFPLKQLGNTLLDGEFIQDLNLFAVFDAYFVNGVDVRARPFEERRSAMVSAVEIIAAAKPTFAIKAKTFYSSKDVFSACRLCLAAVYPYAIDGLIFTPLSLGVGMNEHSKAPPNRTLTWDKSFKWKETNTVDFKVSVQETLEGQVRVGLLVFASASNWENPQRTLFEQNTQRPRNKDGLRPFYTEDDATSHACLLPNPMCTLDGQTFDNGAVVEFKYVGENAPYYNWQPVRVRADKDFPNSFNTAHNTWDAIRNPITPEMVKGEVPVGAGKYYVGNKTGMQAVREFNNFVKTAILTAACNHGMRLIDLAVGRAGDLHKWKELQLAFVFGVDLMADNIHNKQDGACVRYLEATSHYSNTYAIFVQGDTSKDLMSGKAFSGEQDRTVALAILGKVGVETVNPALFNVVRHHNTAFDVCSLMFALHYYYGGQRAFTQLMKNVVACLSVGGSFVGCAWDGCAVFERLKDVPTGGVLQIGAVSICKQYSATKFDEAAPFGCAIAVAQETFTETSEYLVHFGHLETFLTKHGFSVAVHPFMKHHRHYKGRELTQAEKDVCFMNKYFVCKKVNHVDVEVLDFKVKLAGSLVI
jgi:hypothetical protein